MTDMSLYLIALEHKALADQLTNLGHDDQTIEDTLDAESGLIEKADSIAKVIVNMRNLAESIEHEVDRMNYRAERLRQRANKISDYLQQCMELANVDTVPGETFTLLIKKNPPAVDIVDYDLIPGTYMKDMKIPNFMINKKKILEDLKNGIEVPGAVMKQGTRLDIK